MVLDPDLRESTTWKGKLGLNLCGNVYLSFSGDPTDEEYVNSFMAQLTMRLDVMLYGTKGKVPRVKDTTKDSKKQLSQEKGNGNGRGKGMP